MTQAVSAPSPLLERFLNVRPGDIHIAAAKTHLKSGFEACRGNTLVNAVWNQDKSALAVRFSGGARTTFLMSGARLLTTCTCSLWQPARNCPHVVILWATLKRVVSPGSLFHIRFNEQMLLDMKRYIGQEPAAEKSHAGSSGKSGEERELQRDGLLPVPATANTSKYRMVLEQSGHGSGIQGGIKRGDEAVYGWTSHGLPTDLARFLASHYFYDSTKRYFEAYQQAAGSACPIVFRDEEDRETTLVYRGDLPLTSGITFDIRGDEVLISRSYADGTPLPANAVVHGQLLFDIAAGIIVPVTNRDAWKCWEEVFEELDGVIDDSDEFYEDHADDFDDDNREDDDFDDVIDGNGRDGESVVARVAVNNELRRHQHTIRAPLDFFNSAAIRLFPEIIDDPERNCYFRLHGVSPEQHTTYTQSYLLDIPRGLTGSTTVLQPACLFEQYTFSFSNAAFGIFNPNRRTNLSLPMKTKKRIRAVVEAAFALLDETKPVARNTIFRSVTGSSDFLKRNVKREAKQLLTSLTGSWDQNSNIVMATPSGWFFLKEDRRLQARLMKILYELFGLDAFTAGSAPGEVELATDKLLKVLPLLTEQLQKGGFSLRIGSEPLTEALWAFSMDATRSSHDWFELKPEIRCNGELLTEEELRGLMAGGSMLRRGGKLMMLDELSAQVLAMFSGAMPTGKKRKKGEQDLVRVPRLQILDWLQLRNHGVEVRLSPEDAQLLENLLNFSSIPARPLPSGLTATLRHYQVDAWYWLAFLYEHRFGACLADDMGLGKTVQGISLLAGIMSGELTTVAAPGTPHLVVAPPSLLFNWEAELARFLPAARVMIYTGSGRSTAEFTNHDVIITSYGIVQRDCDLLAEQCFNVLIFDETQVVKNLQAATTNAVRKLRGSFTLALTGTPVENHLGEYFAIMDLCLPGLLGTREEFSRKLSQGGAAATTRLIGRTRPFVLRRTKQLIASELPPKIEMDIPLELTTKQRVLYQRTVEEVRGQVQEAYAGHAPAQARIIALTAILRLRQICLAPALASPTASDASPKLEFLAEQLDELRDEGHSALVFSQFTGYLDIIEKGLKAKGFACLRLDGSTPVPRRKQLVETFQNSVEPTVFLISLKAGGKGLNLTRATYVYHMDPWWNPAVENQASDRAHRIGQTEQVTITRLIMKHTIEEKMMALKEQKSLLYKAILEDGAGGGGAGLTREDFDFLLG
ncbi:MAG: DEAD/DEAH box helicase [Desulfuromonadaceae bacterium]|nr:DEAD/DEAH box helicase [Desulfuromonadaceae bacterium]